MIRTVISIALPVDERLLIQKMLLAMVRAKSVSVS